MADATGTSTLPDISTLYSGITATDVVTALLGVGAILATVYASRGSITAVLGMIKKL